MALDIPLTFLGLPQRLIIGEVSGTLLQLFIDPNLVDLGRRLAVVVGGAMAFL